MGKHEYPAFRMVIERGHLVPAFPDDAERLDTWRNGTRVNVNFTEEKDRVLVRKWFAVIGRAVKECKTPWKTKEQASEAIKLSLGIVNLTKTVGGQWMQYPKSLTELDDPELSEAVEQMIDVIYHITGVDPAEWKKQIAHIKDEPQSAAPTADSGSAAPDTSPSAAAPHSADEAETTEAGEQSSEVKTEDRPRSAPASGQFTDEERDWLKSSAKQLIAVTKPGWEADEVRKSYSMIIKTMTPAAISQAAIAKLNSIGKHCAAICDGTEDFDLDLLAGIALCEPAGLRSA